ncbi:META domain-containing protein [Agromyces sp. SYSU K20354]|uniref:META domain-containing protein n=1 Tax=Agromyces cavernae TaxID=2898659 RepID=UPI001E521E3C|nr:META domain-containing protein [Agromyces cavernae]MCD2442568.1 META domain-containing protein [Agromyces cavernae]
MNLTDRVLPTAILRSLVAGAAIGVALVMTGCAGERGPVDEATVVTTWGSEDEGQPHLTFTDDGSVSGSDGCNRLVGSWTLTGDTIATDSLATTRKACEGVDTWLSGFATAVVDGDRLIVSGVDGEQIGVLRN